MDLKKNIREMTLMPSRIKTNARSWSQSILKGGKELKNYGKLCAKILENENIIYNTNASIKRIAAKKRLNRLFKRLGKCYKVMQQILQLLNIIKQRTELMFRRVDLWRQDEELQDHCIVWELTVSKLGDFLGFLYKRYDYEWEVKEVVVPQLKHVNGQKNSEKLLQIWRENRHAGGGEFNRKLREFYDLMGHRSLYLNVLTKLKLN